MIPQHSLPGGCYPLPVPPAGSRQLRLAHTNRLLTGADFRRANVAGVRFDGANLTGTIGLYNQPQPVEVFISYSHKDEPLREKLETHLSLLRRQGVIAA